MLSTIRDPCLGGVKFCTAWVVPIPARILIPQPMNCPFNYSIFHLIHSRLHHHHLLSEWFSIQ